MLGVWPRFLLSVLFIRACDVIPRPYHIIQGYFSTPGYTDN